MFSLIEVAGFPDHCITRPAMDLPMVATLPTEGFSDRFERGIVARPLSKFAEYRDAEVAAAALSKHPTIRLVVICKGANVDAYMTYYGGIPTMVASRTAIRIRHALKEAA